MIYQKYEKNIRHNKICITLKSTPSTNISPLAFDHSQKYLMFYWQVNVRYFGLGWSMSIGLIYGVIKVLPCIFLYLHVFSSSQENDWLKFANKGITEWKFPLSPKTIAFKLELPIVCLTAEVTVDRKSQTH